MRRSNLGDTMTTAQRIYRAIEFFSTKEPHYSQFKMTFREAVVDHGVPVANAGKMAEVAAESLRRHTDRDYHLGMAQIIACDRRFDRAMNGSVEAFQAMHKYMSYYLDYAELQQARVAN